MAYRVGMPSVILGLALLAFWLYCLFDVITTPEESVRNLPKILWLIVVIFLPDLGGIAWFLLGRPRAVTVEQVGDQIVHPSQLGRTASGEAPRGPDDDPEFLRNLATSLREDESMMNKWEADLRRREEELRRRERESE